MFVFHAGSARTKVADETVHLLYVDYGNEEEISISETRPIPSRFCHLPAQALYCSLLMRNEGISLKMGIVLQQWLSRTIVGLPSSVKIKSYCGKNNAVVDIEVSAAFLFSESSLQFLDERCGILPDVIGGVHDMVSVCKVLDSVLDKVNALQHMEPNFSDTPGLDESQVSESLCFEKDCAMLDLYASKSFGTDSLCSPNETSVSVFSHANLLFDKVSHESMFGTAVYSKVAQEIDESIASSVHEQVSCSCKDEEEEQCDAYSSDVVNAQARSVSYSTSSPTLVKAMKPFCLQLEEGSLSFNLMVSHVDSVSSFFVHPVQRNSLGLLDLEMSLNHYYSEPGVESLDSSDVSRGTICCIQCPEDKMWYRAVIVEKLHTTEELQEKYCVFYFDYGVSETVSTRVLKVLHPQFMSVPAQSICCSLTYFDACLEADGSKNKGSEMITGSDDSLQGKLQLKDEDALSCVGKQGAEGRITQYFHQLVMEKQLAACVTGTCVTSKFKQLCT